MNNKRKIALVTGASSGIGKATAMQLIADGYTVYSGARRVEKMQDIKKKGGYVLHLDITDEASRENFVNSAIQNEGRIDVLVNNAGYGHFGTMEDSSIEIGKAMFETNLFGLVRMMQLVIPTMREQRVGTVVNMSSIGGKMTTPFSGWYQSTKYAIECVSDATRMEVEQFGINIVIIEPGLIETEFFSLAAPAIQKISGNGIYKKSAKRMLKEMEVTYADASPPSVIAETISKALKANKPKTRYVAGEQAKVTLLAKRLLSDRMFDNMVRNRTMVSDLD
jgi:NADP-dependent 3-hydroxy acid dehydrogenase YdfG